MKKWTMKFITHKISFSYVVSYTDGNVSISVHVGSTFWPIMSFL